MISKRKLFGISLARRQARRWLVLGFWAVNLSLAVVVSLLTGKYGASYWLLYSWQLISLPLLTGLLGGEGKRGAVRAFEGCTSEEQAATDNTYMTPEDIAERKRRESKLRLDERDVNMRNAAHYKAYSALRWFIFVAFPVMAVPPPREWLFLRSILLLTLFLAVWCLPQTLILWTEPDMEAEQG